MGSDGSAPVKWPAQAAYDAESPTGVILDRIADKWTLMIHGTLEAGPMRFSDLRDALGGISPKVLTQSLRALERDGLISRHAYRQVPPNVEYALTELGGSLCAPVQELRAWAEEHIDHIRDARDRYDDDDGAA
jgi:DNA-binding HxlR family transcriptional regulator